jgi:radical SAM-linked protein
MSETRQRWRLIFARDEEARYLSHLDAVTLWERALRRGAIPVATTEGFTSRPRIIFAAPLQLGMLAEHDLADLYLSERMTVPSLRGRLAAGMPAGYRVIDLHDVWTGATAIAPQLVAADYRMSLLGVSSAQLASAVAGFLAAESRPRIRKRENKTISYDLRPLVLDLRVVEPDPHAVRALSDRAGARAVAALGERADATGNDGAAVARHQAAATPATGLWMRLRHSQDRGSGRPDEVIAALAAELGLFAAVSTDGDGDGQGREEPAATAVAPATTAEPATANATGHGALEIVLPVRERLWLAEELESHPSLAPRETSVGADAEEPE